MATTVQLVDLFHGMIESFKLLLTSQTFGSDYELLCAELSVQLLRIRLWADSVGLVTQDGNPSRMLSSLLDRQGFNDTATQAIESISFLIGELQVIRDKYMRRALPPFDMRRRSATPGSLIKPRESFRLRSWANQKQKSIFAVARWTVRDERRFDKRVKRLGAFITGLEDIARAAARPRDFQVQLTRPVRLGQYDIPPPYSLAPTTIPLQGIREWSLGQVVDASANAPQTVAAASMRQHLFIMQAYLTSLHPGNVHVGPTARDKLAELSDGQITELCVDVHEELLRRQEYGLPTIQPLQERQSFYAERNQARRKLSTLVSARFGHLIEDIVFELKRRYPHLQCIPDIDTPSPPSYRSGCAISHLAHDPTTLSQLQRPHWSTIIQETDVADPPSPSQRVPLSQLPMTQDQETQLTPTQDDGDTHILTSYHVKLDDSCSIILPAVILKYGITAAWQEYSLYIIYDDEERCLEMDEKPLRIFRALEKQGKSPRFMLKKIASTTSTGG